MNESGSENERMVLIKNLSEDYRNLINTIASQYFANQDVQCLFSDRMRLILRHFVIAGIISNKFIIVIEGLKFYAESQRIIN